MSTGVSFESMRRSSSGYSLVKRDMRGTSHLIANECVVEMRSTASSLPRCSAATLAPRSDSMRATANASAGPVAVSAMWRG